MPKFLQDFNTIIDSSAVALLSALSRVLFMSGNEFKARAATFVASVCVGLVAGIIVADFEPIKSWGNLIIGVTTLSAKETIDWLSKKMTNPLGFLAELRGQKETKDDNETPDRS